MDFSKIKYPILILFLVNLVLKCLYLDAQSLSHDEPFSIYHAQFDLPALVGYLKAYNNPPLYEILLHFWIGLFGISEISVRVLPMLFSCFSVVFIYKTAKEFFNDRVAMLSGLVFTFSTFQTWYAHDSRVYTLFLFLATVSFYLFYRLLNGTANNKQLLVLLLVNTLILYAHYFGFFVWFLEGLMVILFYLKNKKVLARYAIIHGLAFLLYMPQIMILFQRFVESSSHGTWLKAPQGIESLYNMIWSFSNAPIVAVACIIVLSAGVIKMVVSKSKDINSFTIYTAIWFLVPFVLMFVVSYKIPMFLDRYLIFITPAFYILVSIAISYVFHKPVAFYVSASVMLLFFVVSYRIDPDKKRPVKDTVRYITERKTSKTLVLVCPGDFNTNFTYYYNQNFFKSIDPVSEYGKMSTLLQQDQVYCINQLDEGIINTMHQYDRIIYLDAGADFAIPDNGVKHFMDTHFDLVEEKQFPELFHVYTYKTAPWQE